MDYLLLVAPDAERLVGHWRADHDAYAAFGIPAHVTVRTPFLPPERWDTDEIAGALGGLLPRQVTLARLVERPGALVVLAEPDGPLRELTDAASRAWPELPRHKGEHARPAYHVTVVRTPDAGVRDRARAEIEPQLPLTVAGTELWAASGTGEHAVVVGP